MKMEDAHEFSHKLEDLKKKYIQALPIKIADLRSTWAHLNQGNWRLTLLLKMRNMAHSIGSSAGTFGLIKISDVAQRIEEATYRFVQKDGDIKTDKQSIELVDELLISLQNFELEIIKDTLPPAVRLNKSNIIYILDFDTNFALHISNQLHHYNYDARVISDKAGVERNLMESKPLAIIIDVKFAKELVNDKSTLDFLTKDCNVNCPLIFVGAQADFAERMYAVKGNSVAFFNKPLDITLLVERLNIVTKSIDQDQYRILLVLKDTKLAQNYTNFFEKHGMQVYVQLNPSEAFNDACQLNPDLLLIDLNSLMDEEGDLIRVIRQHHAFFVLPIIAICETEDHNLQKLSNELGIDDLLETKVDGQKLLNSILNRIQRARYMNAIMAKDSLTGLFTHKMISEFLKSQLNICKRYNRILAYALINVDNFTQICDTYGTAAGDEILISLANTLKTNVRSTEFIARYGAEEFAMVFPESTIDAAIKCLERVGKKFSAVDHFVGHGREGFRATFTAWVTGYPKYTDPDTIMTLTDKARFERNNRSTNQIIIL